MNGLKQDVVHGVYIYIYIPYISYYISHKKGEVLPFATIWMDIEGMMPSKISQMEKDIYCMTLLICGMQKQAKQNK